MSLRELEVTNYHTNCAPWIILTINIRMHEHLNSEKEGF